MNSFYVKHFVVIVQFAMAIFPINMFAADTMHVAGNPLNKFVIFNPGQSTKNTNGIIYIFDPAARGQIAVDVFKTVAQQYNFILIASLTTRNYRSITDNYETALELIKYGNATYKADSSQIFVAGFSGGARLANGLSLIEPAIDGVIACGAGFPNDFQRPTHNSTAKYLWMVGNTDMNYIEMKDNASLMINNGNSTLLYLYEGEHRWPPNSILTQAMPWLIAKNNPEQKPSMHDTNQENSFLTTINQFLQKENLTLAAYYLQHYAVLFPDSPKHDSIALLLDKILGSKAYKKQLKSKLRIEKQERQLIDTYFKTLANNLSNPNDSCYDYWKTQQRYIQGLRQANNTEKQLSAQRLESLLISYCYEKDQYFFKAEMWPQSVLLNSIWCIIEPDNYFAYYRLSIISGKMHQFAQGLKYFNQAASNGLPCRLIMSVELLYLQSTNEYQDTIRKKGCKE